MLHAPTSETKTEAQSKSPFVPQPKRELRLHTFSAAGAYSLPGAASMASVRSPQAQSSQALHGMQSTHGNQAVLRMLHSPQQIARMPALRPSQNLMLQRKCACGGSSESEGECAECKAKREGTLQRSVGNQAAPAGTNSVLPIVHNVLNSPGQPLDTGTRAFMEPRFGHDFSQVRVHTNAKASESARAVNALAYTVGRNVVFRAGQYAPGTQAGQRMLTHELVHVVQQQDEVPHMASKLEVTDPADASELDAERVAAQIDASQGYPAVTSSAPMIARQDDGGTVDGGTLGGGVVSGAAVAGGMVAGMVGANGNTGGDQNQLMTNSGELVSCGKLTCPTPESQGYNRDLKIPSDCDRIDCDEFELRSITFYWPDSTGHCCGECTFAFIVCDCYKQVPWYDPRRLIPGFNPEYLDSMYHFYKLKQPASWEDKPDLRPTPCNPNSQNR